MKTLSKKELKEVCGGELDIANGSNNVVNINIGDIVLMPIISPYDPYLPYLPELPVLPSDPIMLPGPYLPK